MRRYGVTGFQYVGEICRYLVNQPARPDDRDHRVRVMMGAGLGRDVWERLPATASASSASSRAGASTEANTSLINLDNRSAPAAASRSRSATTAA